MSGPPLQVAQKILIGNTDVSLIGSSNIWVDDSLATDSSIKLVQTIAQKALESTAPGQLEIIVYDDGLSGLSAPFWPLNSGGEKILNILNDEHDFKDTLRYLRDHVQGVKNVMQGLTTNLVDFRVRVNYPVEGYKLVIVSTDFSTLDEDTQAHLAILLKAGPSAGVSFLIHSMTLGANPFVIALCDHMTIQHNSINRENEAPIRDWIPPEPQELIEISQRVADRLKSTKMATVSFAEIQDTQDPWKSTSEDGITFSIGKYGLHTVEITLGDELNQRHNMLVTGAVGQGKSNLISVIIHSLCQRYSPHELQLYLLDFKEGVTLQSYFDEDTGEHLPQARVLGLEADREFGRSILQDLFRIFKTRMKIFKSAGVQSLRQYRALNPDIELPRVVVIIDEFQMMFAERDRISDEIAELLVRGVRLFRACGIHVILASQTIGGNMSLMGSAGEGLFGQVPVRVALKNSLTESRATLGDKNDAAAHLRAREAIVNLDYGEVSANKKTSIAFADEAVLSQLRTSWWKANRGAHPPYVFMGERSRSIGFDRDRLRELRADGKFSLLLGERIEVDAPLLEVPFSRDIGRNVAVLGSGKAITQVESMILSLAFQRPATRLSILDFLEDHAEWDSTRQLFVETLGEFGSQVEWVDKLSASSYLSSLATTISSRDERHEHVLVGLGMDRCRSIPTEFQDLIRIGPTVGVHVIGWWLKVDVFRDQIGYGGENYFDTRLALRLDPQSTKQLMGDPLLEWHATDNRMLVWDSREFPEPIRIIPYSILEPHSLSTSGSTKRASVAKNDLTPVSARSTA